MKDKKSKRLQDALKNITVQQQKTYEPVSKANIKLPFKIHLHRISTQYFLVKTYVDLDNE